METISKTDTENPVSTSLLVNLAQIKISETNRIFRRPAEITKDALTELASSIKQYGVIQPVAIRPHRQKPGMFLLICGERRYRASVLAGMNQIPAYVKDVNDETALELQAIENIERENIHPLNEAKGYAVMLENNPSLTTADLATRFAKSETYILQRLKLNELIKEFKKDFYLNTILIGHALLLARLTHTDQREVREQMTKRYNGLGTVNELHQYIDRNIMNSLTTAAFDKKDVALLPKAGACLTCPKRSGVSPLLFAEIKEKDRCFDSSCFFLKCQKHILNKTKLLIETEPEVVFLTAHHETNEDALTLLTEQQISPLREYKDFFDGKCPGTTKAKGFWISGDHAGKIATVYVKGEEKAELPPAESRKEQIEKIKLRMTRGKELDREKVYAKILDALQKHPSQKKTFEKKMMPSEEAMLWYIVYDKAGYHIRHDLDKFLGLSNHKSEKVFQILTELTPMQKAYLLRKVMLDQYGGNHPDSDYGFIITKIAAAYRDIDIPGFQNEQNEICSKREERANHRIKELKSENN
ncbi:MAG: ParB/RepB/Spo0J family partition protein [Cyclobacteriaceae bacterium]|nr:ParB/RepB/Spo0J family partition protein [Cyclobacteriaceae bacterium]